MAESAEGVGRYTVVKVASAGGQMDAYDLSEELVSGIREAWEKEGKPRVPDGIVAELKRELGRHPIVS